MKYAIKYFNDICILEITGHLDFPASQFMDKILEDRIKKSNFSILIDFENIEYIGSSGFSVIINNLIKCREKGGDIKLFCINDEVMKVIKNIRLHKVFEIYKNKEEAINSF